MKTIAITVHALAMLVVLAACSDGGAEQQTAVADLLSPVSIKRIRTTHPDIANRNLDFIVARSQLVLREQPANEAAARTLINHLLTRVNFRNSFEDLTEALAVSKTLFEATESAASRVLRADALSAVHRFDEACGVLAGGVMDGSSEIISQGLTLAVAIGNADAVLSQLERQTKTRPGYTALTTLAAAYREVGDIRKADAAFAQALKSYDDVSPFAVAWVYYQRGNLWQSGDASRARQYYLEALHHLPDYVNAIVHLAEVEAETGASEDAINRLTDLAQWSRDPDVFAVLANLLYRVERREESQRYAAEAHELFTHWLGVYDLAFANHGVEFYSGVGSDPDLARALRLKSVEAKRQNCLSPTSFARLGSE